MDKIALFDVCGTLYSINTTFEFARTLGKSKKQIAFGDCLIIRIFDRILPFLHLRNRIFINAFKN